MAGASPAAGALFRGLDGFDAHGSFDGFDAHAGKSRSRSPSSEGGSSTCAGSLPSLAGSSPASLPSDGDGARALDALDAYLIAIQELVDAAESIEAGRETPPESGSPRAAIAPPPGLGVAAGSKAQEWQAEEASGGGALDTPPGLGREELLLDAPPGLGSHGLCEAGIPDTPPGLGSSSSPIVGLFPPGLGAPLPSDREALAPGMLALPVLPPPPLHLAPHLPPTLAAAPPAPPPPPPMAAPLVAAPLAAPQLPPPAMPADALLPPSAVPPPPAVPPAPLVPADVALRLEAHDPSSPAPAAPEFPSAGSAGHRFGMCKPCAFYHTKGCNSGWDCTFCHLCGPKEVSQRKKEKKTERQNSRTSRGKPRALASAQ